jgi:hypothetical protein
MIVRTLFSYSYLILTLCLSERLQAQVSISSVSGSFTHGANITITGSGFGSHPDWGGSAEHLNAVWNDFSGGLESGGLRFGAYPAMSSKWSLQVSGTRGNPAGRFARKIYEVANTGGSGRLGALEHLVNSGRSANRFYTSFWFKTGQLNVQVSGKHYRQYFDVGNFWAANGGIGADAGLMRAHSERGTVPSIYGSDNGIAFPGETWVWQEFIVCLNGCEGIFGSGDYVETRINGIRWWRRGSGLSSNAKPNECSVCNESSNWVGGATGTADNHTIDIGMMIDPASLQGGSDAGSHYDFSDVYINYGFQRICLSDQSLWNLVTHCELQTPLSWSNSRITIKLNRGSFANFSSKYLYVIDASNVANANGFPVTGGSAQTPIAPRNLRIAP